MTSILYHKKYLNMNEISPIKEKLMTFRFSENKLWSRAFANLQIYEDKYRFILDGIDCIKNLVIDFDKEGNYIGIDMVILPSRRPKGSRIISGTYDYKQARTDEVNQILLDFKVKMIANNYLK